MMCKARAASSATSNSSFILRVRSHAKFPQPARSRSIGCATSRSMPACALVLGNALHPPAASMSDFSNAHTRPLAATARRTLRAACRSRSMRCLSCLKIAANGRASEPRKGAVKTHNLLEFVIFFAVSSISQGLGVSSMRTCAVQLVSPPVHWETGARALQAHLRRNLSDEPGPGRGFDSGPAASRCPVAASLPLSCGFLDACRRPSRRFAPNLAAPAIRGSKVP
jgi:hypothetical protein